VKVLLSFGQLLILSTHTLCSFWFEDLHVPYKFQVLLNV
jgi:hypothetical protein